jgi:hypothetical protein
MTVDKKFTSPIIQDAKLIEFKTLFTYMTEDSSVHSLVIGDVCMEGAQLHQLNMVTHLENWPWNSEGLGAFCRHGNLAGFYGIDLILFHVNAQPHSKLRTCCKN